VSSRVTGIAEEDQPRHRGARAGSARARWHGAAGSGSLGRLLPVVLALSLLILVGAVEAWAQVSEAAKEGREGRRKENSIQLVVDGVPRKTWTVGELMAAKFDWVSPKGKVSPAVPLTLILHDPASGVAAESLAAVRVVTGKGHGVDLKGPALAHLNDLLLKVDVDKGGQWKLVSRDLKAEAIFGRILGKRVALAPVSRIEVVTSPDTKPSD